MQKKTDNIELFTGKADAYAKSRPGYPPEAIEYIAALVPKTAVFADIGAGTGIFTKLLAEKGYTVFAAEPNTDMESHLRSILAPYKNASILTNPGENTQLADKSVDAIVCAQSLHWLDLKAFKQECLRIGKNGCQVFAIYNITPGGNSKIHCREATSSFFKNPVLREFSHPIMYTREKWVSYMTSHSHNPLPGDPDYDRHIEKVNRIFDRESAGGILEHRALTRVFHEKICY